VDTGFAAQVACFLAIRLTMILVCFAQGCSTMASELDVTDFSSILPWYESARRPGKGKAHERVLQILPLLGESERLGAWLPKASRTVRAVLSKQPAAEAFARANERRRSHVGRSDLDVGLLEDVRDVRGKMAHEAKYRGWHLVYAMMFGRFWDAPQLVELADRLASHTENDAERLALARARQWAVDFSPLARVVAQLDATRPKPSYEFGEISATVRSNVQDEMKLAFETVRVPEIRWTKVQVEVKGQLVWTWVGEVLWPEGTRHGASRFSVSAAGADQCQACGHAIRDSGNWCPLLLDGPGGPASLWVGRDCARHLFGCRVGGEGSFLRGLGHASS
jgi:hypothetical protein